MRATRYQCQRCGHQWEPRRRAPLSCPRCRSYRWQQPRPADPPTAKHS